MRYRFTKYLGDDLEGLDIDELFAQISDLLLASGFRNPYAFDETEQTLQALHDAVLDAVLHGGLLPQETLDRLLGDEADAEGRARLEQLVEQIIERLQTQGYIAPAPERTADRREGAPGGRGPDLPPVRFEVTDKGLDFLGYRALRDLLGSLGKSSVGRHDTRDLATGVEVGGPAKPYEFGDTLNLDASATILHAVERSLSRGGGAPAGAAPPAPAGAPDAGLPAAPFEPIDVQYEDLMVSQGEFQSSCATVLLLDCSHSMILYGEDRFTPAKRVALALASLIRSQYPGDSLQVVLFHDSAEEIPLRQLARVRVGPYYTNTREGLRLARRLLERQRRDMRQIIMITDGKPSATTRPDGRVYRNAFGLDPFIVTETFAEVAACRRAGIMINTFMLARDYDLVAFVRKVAEICRGKAYFTTPYTLGQYVLMDYLNKKTRTVH
ncbi:MAG TPA: VWA domain-containing protein [Vicinamibacterales bacterium]|nr:VWA domain-containing protein [Vicinamibacterales bacterium]